MGVQIPPWQGGILGGKEEPIVSIGTFSCELCENDWTDRFAVLDCWLGWAEGSTSSIVFASWRQCVNMVRHIDATWQIQLKLSVCGGDAILCQITLTTCSVLLHCRARWHCSGLRWEWLDGYMYMVSMCQIGSHEMSCSLLLLLFLRAGVQPSLDPYAEAFL